ncbi:AMP-binding protein [Micromonospora echinofusca]|uniref:AMP-binding protein n=1 Tax=Micromonospora echinofusca TaxID=47858 RepID=UPI0027DE8A47|nr:AMP-binding protein [Micromonospora echinofusca]
MQDAFSIPSSTLADRLRHAATRQGDRPALHWREVTLTWAEFDAAVDDVGQALRATVTQGGEMPPPDQTGVPARVAIALPNTPDFAVAFLAALRAGLVAVPVNPELTAPELRHVLADSGATVLVGTAEVADLASTVTADLPGPLTVYTGLPAGPGAAGSVHPDRSGEDLAVLLYTSGTEGRPKGAMLTHRALLANHEQIARIDPPVVGPEDTVLLALPLFHAYGLNSGLGAVVYHGATGVLIDRFDPAGSLVDVARHRVTVLAGVPSMFLAWSAQPDLAGALASVRAAVCGAAPLPVGTAARFAEAAGRPVGVGYGLTETAPVLTSTLVDGRFKPGSIGTPIPGVELRLVGADGVDLWRDGTIEAETDTEGPDLAFSSPGTDPGEIVVRGANLFSGYWPDGRGSPDPDGWWATGDIAYADGEGDLFLVDRLGELILVNGFNVYPHEVELVLQSHPGVVESAVLGVPHPRTGQSVRAYVVPAPGSPVGEAELLAHCARNLARFKCPTGIDFVDTLPHSVIGKVRKRLLPAARTGTEVPDGD